MTILGIIAALWATTAAGALALCRVGQPSRRKRPAASQQPALHLVVDG